ncbi:hypothetical protein HYV81_06480 [Candidatus Woesearchaeota archaeon]|nr:hypothetical protein [Candidatus Woesearchaeota archaeon]
MKLKQKLGPDAARWFLREITGPECFWVNNGPILKSIEELAAAVRAMKKEVFLHHVNKDKNDLARWIEEVVGDNKLAADMRKSRSRRNILQALNMRVKILKRIAELDR